MGRRVAPLVAVLALLGAGGIWLRSWSLGYPLVPRITEQEWQIRLSVQWEASQAPVSVLLPRDDDRQDIRDERVSSPGLEATIWIDRDGRRRLQWAPGDATSASYEAEMTIRTSAGQAGPVSSADLDRWRRTDELPPAMLAAATRLTSPIPSGEAPRRCADLLAGRTQPSPESEENLRQLREGARSPAEALVVCWRSAGLPARVIQVLPLKAGILTRPTFLAQVFEKTRWLAEDPERGLFPMRERSLLTWTWGTTPLAEGLDGRPARWQIEVHRRPLALWRKFFEHTANQASFLARWSLYQLPPDAQEVFRVLLLVPLGALLAAFLRNVVGLGTFGTFMPILIAIAFRQTELLYGLVLFTLIVAAGYAVRLAIEHYKLLLVPRLSAILTFVIGCLVVLSLVGHHLASRNVISVGLLPIVILTMTIERFHVEAEESGPGAALGMAARTVAVAALIYALLSWEYLQLVLFTYPESLLVVAAGQIALGRYVGFRLTELWRFRRLGEPP